jgi:hypothetical protein
VLTTEGAAVLAHAERLEEEARAFERQQAGPGRQLEGLIRDFSSDWFGAHILMPIFAPFVRQHPKVTVELIADARLFSLARREADLDFPDAAWLRRKLPEARAAFGSNSRDAQAPMCAAGVGRAVLPAPGGGPTPQGLQANRCFDRPQAAARGAAERPRRQGPQESALQPGGSIR